MLSDRYFRESLLFYQLNYMYVGLVFQLVIYIDKLISIKGQLFDSELERGIRRGCLIKKTEENKSVTKRHEFQLMRKI